MCMLVSMCVSQATSNIKLTAAHPPRLEVDKQTDESNSSSTGMGLRQRKMNYLLSWGFSLIHRCVNLPALDRQITGNDIGASAAPNYQLSSRNAELYVSRSHWLANMIAVIVIIVIMVWSSGSSSSSNAYRRAADPPSAIFHSHLSTARVKPNFHYADFPVTSATVQTRDVPFSPSSITATSRKLPLREKFPGSRRNETLAKGVCRGRHGEVGIVECGLHQVDGEFWRSN